MENMIKDISLAPEGAKKIEWVKGNMPLLNEIEKDFKENQYFKGLKAVVCIHLEAKTAYLAKVLKSGGADVYVCGSNPLSTQDDVAAALAADGLYVYSWYNATEEEYFRHIDAAISCGPDIVIDDGGDIVNILHTKRRDLIPNIMGGNEETTTGVLRLKARQAAGELEFPMFSVNDADCKHLFDNRYGTGQSVWDGINRTTNLIVAGKNVVVAGYGWCGKGVAMRAKGLGADVIVCEINPIRAIEAIMDGFKVMPMNDAAKIGDFFVTVTGCDRVIYNEHFDVMKDGAILCNAGHFDVEISMKELREMSVEIYTARNNITCYRQSDGRKIFVLAEGRLVNLAAGDGHPAEIMDMSFAIQALCAKYIVENHNDLSNKVYNVPVEIDKYVAALKLKTLGVSIDKLTAQQEKYINSSGE